MESVFGVSLSDRLLSAHSLNGLVQVWNLENNTLVDTVSGVNRYSSSVRFSPYGGRLAYGTVVDLVVFDPVSADWNGGRLAYGTVVDLVVFDPVSADWTGPLGVETFVPFPTLDRLNAIADLCVQDSATRTPPVAGLTARPVAALDALPDFVAQIEALPDGAIPPACRADLLAVAGALAAGE